MEATAEPIIDETEQQVLSADFPDRLLDEHTRLWQALHEFRGKTSDAFKMVESPIEGSRAEVSFTTEIRANTFLENLATLLGSITIGKKSTADSPTIIIDRNADADSTLFTDIYCLLRDGRGDVKYFLDSTLN